MIIGTGIDIVELARLHEKIERTPRLLERILTEKERMLIPNARERRLEYIAGRFAVKEAFSKALGVGIGAEFGWHDISILNDDRGRPYLEYHREDFRNVDWQMRKTHISISHERTYVVAFVVIEEN